VTPYGRKSKPPKIKVRRRWIRHPATQVFKDKSKYRRAAAKRQVREELEQEVP